MIDMMNFRESDETFLQNRVKKIRRSTLIVPGNVERFLKKAVHCHADTVQLDLEDSVPWEQKQKARELVRDFLEREDVRAEVNIRINSDDSLWEEDLKGILCKRLDSITIPKCEDAFQIQRVDERLTEFEKEAGIELGKIKLSVLIESVRGLHNIETLLGCSKRIDTVTLGNEDFLHDLGIPPSDTGEEVIVYHVKVIYYARLFSVMPLGMVGSIADYRNLDRFRMQAQKSKQLGYMGSSCIHPDQIPILNDVFTPSIAEVERAKKIVEVFEQAVRAGRGSCSLDGKMIDPPVYQRALYTLERYRRMQRR